MLGDGCNLLHIHNIKTGQTMNWDDNWTRALATVGAAAAGAIATALVGAYAANRKIREVELQYLYKLRDGYLDNARKVAGEVYIPISIALTSLSNSYERLAVNSAGIPTENAKAEFRAACLQYIDTIDELLARGADAYLTTELDERLNGFRNFVRNSIDQQHVIIRRILTTDLTLFGLSFSPRASIDSRTKSRFQRTPIPDLSVGTIGIRLKYSQRILAAPLESSEFEAQLKMEIPQIKFLVKEVVLGSNPPS